MNFKIDSFKIRNNSWILGTFKIHKIRILNYVHPTVHQDMTDFSRRAFWFSAPYVCLELAVTDSSDIRDCLDF